MHTVLYFNISPKMYGIYLLFFCLSMSVASQLLSYKYLGCFLGENLLSLGDESRVLSPMSTQSCSEFCSKKNYMFFILKNDTCYCSKNYISILMKQFDSDCTIKCIGDKEASCGGSPNFVSSYITDNSKFENFIKHGGYPIPIYLGCYFETSNVNEIRLLRGTAETLESNTPQKCSEICFNIGYLYSGVTNGSECLCGNQQPSKLSKIDDTKSCNSPCSGDTKQFCGGVWKMGIYSTGITDYTPRKYVGCFEDDEKKTKGKHLSYQMGTNNSPKRCMNLCNTQRFQYAAVMENTCECKNYEPDFNLKRSHSDCTTPCTENPSEYCGGGVSLQNVYKTLYSDPPGKVIMIRIGCYKNVQIHPNLKGWKISVPNLTPEYCVKSCFARRFLYATLVSSNECLCSFMKPHDDAITVDTMCTIPCSGSSEQTCGGNNTVDVYSTGLEWRTEASGSYYIGCFEDNRYIRVYDGYFQYFFTNTPEFCSDHCYKHAYRYAGVSHKSECFCDIQPPNYIRSPLLEDNQCNATCPGDNNQLCGGIWKMGVFDNGLNHFGYDESLLGCFIPQENTLTDMTFSLTQSNRPTLCFRLCNDFGYQFAGIMGTDCLCGNSALDKKHEVNMTECTKPCVGPWGETCGGEDRIHMYDLKNNIKHSYTHEPIKLQEDFDALNLKSLWNHEIYIPQEPDYEFNIYNNSGRNSFVKNGELVIKPTILPDSFVKKGCLILKGCTKNEELVKCAKNASSFHIIPPIVSAKLTTKNHLFFRYGELEVIAKLPTGDWIVSEIAMVSKSNEQNKLVLANSGLQCNKNESAVVIKYGLKIDEQYNLESKIMESKLLKRPTDEYHSFVLSWSPDNIVFKIDGRSNYLNASNLPLNIILDSEYYISIGVSVGGMTNFPDNCWNNGHSKPWTNFDNKAMLNFYQYNFNWSPTWSEDKSSLRVKSVKFTAKEKV